VLAWSVSCSRRARSHATWGSLLQPTVRGGVTGRIGSGCRYGYSNLLTRLLTFARCILHTFARCISLHCFWSAAGAAGVYHKECSCGTHTHTDERLRSATSMFVRTHTSYTAAQLDTVHRPAPDQLLCAAMPRRLDLTTSACTSSHAVRVHVTPRDRQGPASVGVHLYM